MRPQAQRVVVLNDVRAPDPLAQESEEEFRRVEQTVAILRGYGNAIYRWSERETPQFRHLWRRTEQADMHAHRLTAEEHEQGYAICGCEVCLCLEGGMDKVVSTRLPASFAPNAKHGCAQ
jgi:hypothetical protein